MGYHKILSCPKCGCPLCKLESAAVPSVESSESASTLCTAVCRHPCPAPCPPSCPPSCSPPCCSECPKQECFNRAYAQYSIYSNRASDTLLPFRLLKESGGLTAIVGEDSILFSPGYIYYVSYTLLATPENGNYYQILPIINGSLKLIYATFTPANERRSASVSSGFLLSEAEREEATLRLRLTYPPEVNNIDLSGGLSIFPVAAA